MADKTACGNSHNITNEARSLNHIPFDENISESLLAIPLAAKDLLINSFISKQSLLGPLRFDERTSTRDSLNRIDPPEALHEDFSPKISTPFSVIKVTSEIELDGESSLKIVKEQDSKFFTLFAQTKENQSQESQTEQRNSASSQEFQIEKENENGPPVKKCGCKKSRCLKLYCECFTVKEFCNSTCGCVGCLNTQGNEEMIKKKFEETQEKNNVAFDSKYKFKKDTGQKFHARGCNCTKTGCIKKYCECFRASTGCSSLCKCTNCKNKTIHFERWEAKEEYVKVLRKRSRKQR